jgi:transcription termination/antitermination protein NusG
MMMENIRDQDDLNRPESLEPDELGAQDAGTNVGDTGVADTSVEDTRAAKGIEYIGNEPIKGPLIGSEQPTEEKAGALGKEPPADEAEAADEPPAAPSPEAEELNWYFVHCYSGYENKVKHNLEQRIEAMGVSHLIDKVVVPTEEEMEVRDGKRKTVERRVFPGYILVHMKLDERAMNVVRSTPGVTRFVGIDNNKPTPLSQQEVNQIMKRMEAEAPKLRVNFRTGQKVRITDGPFADFMGLVDKIDTERAKVTVLVSFFGRETPVELDFMQVERM